MRLIIKALFGFCLIDVAPGSVLQQQGDQYILPKLASPINSFTKFNQNQLPSPNRLKTTPAPAENAPVLMDYYVPPYPHAGHDMVLTCGFLHQRGLHFKSFEWSRKRQRVEGLFFHYANGRASVYTVPGDLWMNRSQTSYMLEDRRDHHGATITVLTLRLHRVTERMSGKYKCQVSMTPDEDTKTERLATRSTRVMVVEKNSVDLFTPGVEIAVIRDMEGGLLLVCSASGNPAPALSWSVMVGETLEEVADRVTWHPTTYDQEGVENASVSLRQPCCGLFACTATSRSGVRESHFISTEREDSGLEATFIGTTTTTTTPAPEVEEEPESPLPLILTVLALLLALILAIAILCCCLSCNRRRRTKERRRKALTAKLAQERGRATLRSTLARRPRSRSLKSIKTRRAPNPKLFAQPSQTPPNVP